MKINLEGQIVELLHGDEVASVDVLLTIQAARVSQMRRRSFDSILEFIVEVLLRVVLVMLVHHEGTVVGRSVGVIVVQLIGVNGAHIRASILNGHPKLLIVMRGMNTVH